MSKLIYNKNGGREKMNPFKSRNRLFMFVLMDVLGLFYFFWWQAETQNSFRTAEGGGMSGGKTVLLSIVTLGIFGIVWQWKKCRAIRRLGGANLCPAFIVLYLFCLLGAIFVPLLIQREVNYFAENPVNFGWLIK